MHNQHFVVWMSMQDAQYTNSMKYARKMEAQLTLEHVTFMLAGVIPMGAVFLEAFATMPWHVMIRFGKWDDISPLATENLLENTDGGAPSVFSRDGTLRYLLVMLTRALY